MSVHQTLSEAIEDDEALVAIWIDSDGPDPDFGGAVVGLSSEVVRVENMQTDPAQGRAIRDIPLDTITDVEIERP